MIAKRVAAELDRYICGIIDKLSRGRQLRFRAVFQRGIAADCDNRGIIALCAGNAAVFRVPFDLCAERRHERPCGSQNLIVCTLYGIQNHIIRLPLAVDFQLCFKSACIHARSCLLRRGG